MYDPETRRRLEQAQSIKLSKKSLSTCQKCQCQYFELIKVSQFDDDKFCILGQQPPVEDPVFYLLKCVKCSTLREPNVDRTLNQQTKAYDEMLEQVKETK